MIVKLVSTALGLFGAFWLFFAGIAFEHRPHGWPNLAVSLGPFHPVLHLPDGPYARLDALLAAEKAAAVHTQAVEVAQAQISAAASVHEQAAQTVIRTVTRTIIKDVPTYVTAQDDLRYPLSVGFVRVHDAAALGVDVSQIPGPAGRSDDQVSPVKPSDAAAVIAGNYGEARADAERLTALQDWVTAQQAASTK